MNNSQKNIEAAEALSMMMADAPPAEEKSGESATYRVFASGGEIPSNRPLMPASPYEQSLWVYRCVKVIADNAAKLPVMVSRGEALGTRAYGQCKRVRVGRMKSRRKAAAVAKASHGDIIESHPFIELLRRPNPEQTWNQFFRITVALTQLTGRCMWLFDEMDGRMRPRSMYAVSGNGFTPEYREEGRIKKLIGWYVYTARHQREFIPLTDAVVFTALNPLRPNDGLSPVEPARLAISSDYQASRYNAYMFGNNAEPAGVLKAPGNFDRQLNEDMRTTWQQRHGGSANARKVAILWGGMDWISVASTMEEMQFLEGKKLDRTEICAAWGVPEVVAGFYTDANYGFAESGRGQFYEDTLLPLLDDYAEVLQLIANRFEGNLEVWFDAESSPTVQRIRNNNLDAVDRLWNKGVPLADLNELYDLGLPEQPWHKTGFLTMGLSPAAEVAAGGMGADFNYPEGDGSDAPPADDEDSEQPQRGTEPPHRKTNAPLVDTKTSVALWQNWMKSWMPLAKDLRNKLRARLQVQQRKLVASLKRNILEARSHGAKADESVIGRIILDVFGDGDDRKAFRARIAEFIKQTNMLGIRQALKEAGYTAEQIDATLKELMADRRITDAVQRESVRISQAVDDSTRKIVRRQLAAGLDKGEDIRKLADRVQGVMGNRRTAAMTIARNAVGNALSESRQAGQVRAGMTHKTWMHSRGPGERRTEHMAAERYYASSPIPMDQPFVVGGEQLMYPRDKAGSPKNVINCQCVTIATRAASVTEAREKIKRLAIHLATKGFEV